MDDSQYRKLYTDARNYLNTRYDLLRLELLDKMSRIIGLVLMAMIVILLVFAALGFFAFAIVFLLRSVMPMPVACCIMGAFYLVLIALVVAFRKQWFINPMVRTLSAILFQDNNPEEEGEHE